MLESSAGSRQGKALGGLVVGYGTLRGRAHLPAILSKEGGLFINQPNRYGKYLGCNPLVSEQQQEFLGMGSALPGRRQARERRFNIAAAVG